MRVEKHDLAHEFPEYRDQIQRNTTMSTMKYGVSKWRLKQPRTIILKHGKSTACFYKDELYAILRASHSV